MVNKSRYILWREKNPKKLLLKYAKRRAKKKGREFSLTEEDIKIPEVCPVLGIPLETGGICYDTSPSIDRIDQSRGYSKDNVIVVSYKANVIRGTSDPISILKVGDFYHKILKLQEPVKGLSSVFDKLEKSLALNKYLFKILVEGHLISPDQEKELAYRLEKLFPGMFPGVEETKCEDTSNPEDNF